MDLGSVFVGFAIGWAVQALVDVVVYRGVHSYPKALARAQERIDVLTEELAAGRRPASEPVLAPMTLSTPDGPDPRDETICDLEREIARLRATPAPATLTLLEGPVEEEASGEHAPEILETAVERILELERRLTARVERNADEAVEAARRQNLLEARLMDVESELVSYRLGISPVSSPVGDSSEPKTEARA